MGIHIAFTPLLDLKTLTLRTTVLPMARAGAIFQVRSMRGKFHGTMAPTTPMEDQPTIFSSMRLAHPACGKGACSGALAQNMLIFVQPSHSPAGNVEING